MGQRVPGPPLGDIGPKKFQRSKAPNNIPLQNSPAVLKSGGGLYPVNFIPKSSF